jgi:hypothetical protein
VSPDHPPHPPRLPAAKELEKLIPQLLLMERREKLLLLLPLRDEKLRDEFFSWEAER